LIVPTKREFASAVLIALAVLFSALAAHAVVSAYADDDNIPRWGTPWTMYRFTVADSSVLSVAEELRAETAGLTQRNAADHILFYVQNKISYVADNGEHYQFAGETLRLGHGDCEDMAILLYTLYKTLGFNAVMIVELHHVYVGVALPGYDADAVGNYVTLGSVKYFTADPTTTKSIGAIQRGNEVRVIFVPEESFAAGIIIVCFLFVFVSFLWGRWLYKTQPIYETTTAVV